MLNPTQKWVGFSADESSIECEYGYPTQGFYF